MADLSVRIGSLRLKNPVIAASGCFGYGVEYAGALTELGEASSSENSDGTSGPWVRSEHRCVEGGTRLRREIIVMFPADSEHWRWLDDDGEGDGVCIPMPAPVAPPDALMPAHDRRDWLCPRCYATPTRICYHDSATVDWERLPTERVRRAGCGREFLIDIITEYCPRCGQTATHAALVR